MERELRRPVASRSEDCAAIQSIPAIDLTPSPHHLAEFEEARGEVVGVLTDAGYCIVTFAWGEIAMPLVMADRIKGLIGRKTAILRLEGYRIREI
jgi:hypothetical protein